MWRSTCRNVFNFKTSPKVLRYSTENNIPNQADVIVIGGGVAGCSLLYHLSKRGINAILLEKAKITSGTTWHTSALCWRLKPNDVDIKLMDSSRTLLMSLEEETGLNTGWISNGALFIAKTEERLKEYKRLQTFSRYFNIESHIISSQEAAKLSKFLDPKKFIGALYSPGDGYADPSMYCASLTKGATNKGARIIENCSVTNILTESSSERRKITGVETSKGIIKTNCIVNAAGVWSRNIAQLVGQDIPVLPLKHAYVITDNTIPEAKTSTNIRDHDGSVYMRMQGESIYLGGYEPNPVIIKDMPSDFQFSLFDLDDDILERTVMSAADIAPVFEKVPIKANICGAESFTPDHKPIMGEDPNVSGFYYSCAYNSLGINLSGGCAEQMAIWVSEGRPELPMFNYDIRRFTPKQRRDRIWLNESVHEGYSHNFGIVYPRDQPLAGRNRTISPFHEALVANGAVMEQAQGWERPAYFLKEQTAPIRSYDWGGFYDNMKNTDERYKKEIEGDCTFNFSKHQDLVGEEAKAVRNNVALFDFSYFTKMYLTGPDAEEAAKWLFTADTSKSREVVYSFALNSKGGVEADVTVTPLENGDFDTVLKDKGYYIVARGTSGYQPISHLREEINRKGFKAVITDITDRLGVLSIQGPKSRELVQSLTETSITDEKFTSVKVKGHLCQLTRLSFIEELGYELHIPLTSCVPVFNKVIDCGRDFNMRHAGFRALNSLTLESGYPLWNYDLRTDDNPVEANLQKFCRKDGEYLGKEHVEIMKHEGVKKRRVFFALKDHVALYGGVETIWRDDQIVGFLRRGDYGYSLNASFGSGYVEGPNGQILTDEFLKNGNYEIEVLGKKYAAILYLNSPFDTKNK